MSEIETDRNKINEKNLQYLQKIIWENEQNFVFLISIIKNWSTVQKHFI